MAENTVLVGYNRPFKDDPAFIIAMAHCNQSFTPLRKLKEEAEKRARVLGRKGEK